MPRERCKTDPLVDAIITAAKQAGMSIADKIRGLGPLTGGIYPWNVADYLQFPDLNSK